MGLITLKQKGGDLAVNAKPKVKTIKKTSTFVATKKPETKSEYQDVVTKVRVPNKPVKMQDGSTHQPTNTHEETRTYRKKIVKTK